MYILTAHSPFMTTPGESFASVSDCERTCEERYKVKGLKFAWKEGAWRCVVAGEEGAIVLKLSEVRDGN